MDGVLRNGRRQVRRLLVVCVLGGATAAGFAVAALADTSGAGVTPTTVAGNPAECSTDLGITGATTLTYNSNKSGTVSDGTATATVTTVDSITFDFSAQLPSGRVILAVLAKGGSQGGNLYDYRSRPGGGVLSDTGLHPPPTGNGSQNGGLSHVVFCYGNGTPVTSTTTGSPGTTTVTATPTKTTAGTTTSSSPPTTTQTKAGVKAVTKHKKHKKHKKHLSRKPVRSLGFTG